MIARRLRLGDEQGIAVIIALTTITITAALAVALLTSATGFVESSSRDASSKRALAAAQAGLNVAKYRFALIAAAPSGSFANNCITDREVAWSSTSPHCPAATEYFNQSGASGSYYLTPDLSAALTGMSTIATACGSSTPGYRCLTSIGTANGVTRRVQQLLKSEELFSIHGMTGLKKTEINSSESWSGPNFQVTSDTGSNGAITYGENVSPPGSPYHCEVGPSGSAPAKCELVKRATNITVPSVDTLPFKATEEKNSDAGLTGYSAATRSLTVAAGATLTLAEGVYNFCYVNLENNATLSAAVGARVQIYVDSPARTGVTTCKAPSGGKFNAKSTGAKLNLGESQGQLELYLYGTATPPPSLESPPPATCNNDFNFNNSASSASSNLYIYAPDSNVLIESEAYEMGAVVACQMTYWANKAGARWDYPPSGTRPSNGFGWVSGSFRECTPTYATDPQTGCG